MAEFSPDAVKNSLILCLMISPKQNDKVVQTIQHVIVYTRSVKFCEMCLKLDERKDDIEEGHHSGVMSTEEI